MCRLILTAGLCLAIASLASASSLRLVCYYRHSAPFRAEGAKVMVSELDPTLCTHLIYAYSNVTTQNELIIPSKHEESNYRDINAHKTRNPQLKTLLAIGRFHLQEFTDMMVTQQSRKKFIESAVKQLRDYEFDGVNLDWRNMVPAAGQQQAKENFALLCKEVNEAFVAEAADTGKDRLLITASFAAVKAAMDASYDVPQIAKYVDFINVITKAFHSANEDVTAHHSPLFKGSQDTGDAVYLNTEYAMQYLMDQGAPAQKLNLGLAAYGVTFELSSASNGLGAPASGPGKGGPYIVEDGFLTYYEICSFLDGATTEFITDQKVPYATKGNQWVGFDNKDSLAHKVCYLRANKFGGAFAWTLDLDDFNGERCQDGKYPFTSHVQKLLGDSCENNCTGNITGLFPNSSDPQLFYCGNGVNHLQLCPANLVFFILIFLFSFY